MYKLKEIFNDIKTGQPFCFVRINDGEVKAILDTNAFVSRASDKSSKLMSEKINNIITDNFLHDHLYIGIPCELCYKQYHDHVMHKLIKKNYLNYFDANLLINVNYNKTLEVLSTHLHNRNVVIIGNDLCIKNIEYLKEFNIKVVDTITISTKYAFETDYERLSDKKFDNNTFIITLCGPLGRVLCYEWFKNNTTLSCLDLGSFFDPLLQNKSYFYHTNNFQFCLNCYPTSYSGFSDIFNYCTNNVSKECYYLPTLDAHLYHFGHDYNRIINNTIIRLEKEPDNPLLHIVLTYAKIQKSILWKLVNYENDLNEGFILQCPNEFSALISIIREHKPKTILEIGFLVGTSSMTFLENSEAVVTSIELKESKYTNQAKDILDTLYPGRHTLIFGDSTIVVPTLSDVYDMIFVDGGHDYDTALQDIINGYYHAHNSTVVIIDDVVNYTEEFKSSWTHGPTTAVNIAIKNKLITPFLQDEFEYGRGIIACKYNKKIDIKNITCNIENITDNDLIDKYTNILFITRLLNSLNKEELLNEGYTYQNHSLFFELMSICKKYQPFNVLEIGFLYGVSSLMFLLNTPANVTSIEINRTNPNITIGKQSLTKMFSNRFTLLYGDSNEVLQVLSDNNNVYDMIFIDGNHDKNHLLFDYTLLTTMCTTNTIFILNDVVKNPNLYMSWNFGPNELYDYLISNDYIDVILCKSYGSGRGLAVFTLKKKITENLIKCFTKSELEQIIYRKEYTSTIMSYFLRVYFTYFHLILTDDDYFALLLRIDSITHFESMFTRYVPELVKVKTLEVLKDKYKPSNTIIPKIIHLIYFNKKPLKDYNYKCINSIIQHMPDYMIYIYNDIEPIDNEWNKIKLFSNVNIVQTNRITYYDDFKIEYVQYEADILRLELLYKYGGIYIDTDMFIFKNFENLIKTGVYYGIEKGGAMINSIIISEPNNGFIKELLHSLKTGLRIGQWGAHIRDIPKLLLDTYPYYMYKYDVHLLDYEYFFNIHWSEKHVLNDPNFKITEKMYGVHLYDTILHDMLSECLLLNKPVIQ